MAFRAVLASDALPPGKPAAVQVGEEQLCLVRLADQVVAFPDRCPHRGAPLSEGTLDGAVLTCFRHTWQFDVRTGAPVRLRAPDRLDLRATRERDGCIEVDA